MEIKKGFDEKNWPLIGTRWKFENGEGPLTVERIAANGNVTCRREDGTVWMGVLTYFQAGRYTLLGPAEKVGIPNKLGLDADGLPILGSVWTNNQNYPNKLHLFIVREILNKEAKLTLIQLDGKSVNPDPGHSWGARSIAESWKLISIPDPNNPVLAKMVRQDPTALEASMRIHEKEGRLDYAKSFALKVPAIRQLHESLLAEELAVEEKRIIRMTELEKMGSGDKAAWKMRGLNPFKHYASQMPGWFWYR